MKAGRRIFKERESAERASSKRGREKQQEIGTIADLTLDHKCPDPVLGIQTENFHWFVDQVLGVSW